MLFFESTEKHFICCLSGSFLGELLRKVLSLLPWTRSGLERGFLMVLEGSLYTSLPFQTQDESVV